MNASRRREVESSAVAAAMPVIALLPVWAIAITVFWLPLQLWAGVPWWVVACTHLLLGLLLFWRPMQRLVLMRLLGARRPHPTEAHTLEQAWRQVAQANQISPGRFLVAVVDGDDLNAFACGGHLLVVTSFAVKELPPDELRGVLAHELSHHLGSHTVASTIGLWISLPVMLLARFGSFLRNVARAATDSFARDSAALTALGQFVAIVLTAVSWVFISGLVASNWLSNRFGKAAEFQADRRVVAMGFGRELANALRRVMADSSAVGSSHPPARTRVARIEALLRSERQRRPAR
jgi:Zn-dependent protease with chaperone function